MKKTIYLLSFILLISFSFAFDLNTIQDNSPHIIVNKPVNNTCPAGYVVQNLTNSNSVECVNVSSLVNVTGGNSTANLTGYAKLDGSTGSFFDNSFEDTINTLSRILYNQDGNSLCTWSNDLGTGFDCVTLSQNGNTVLDTSNFVSYVNETYGNHYCENSTDIYIGAYHAC